MVQVVRPAITPDTGDGQSGTPVDSTWMDLLVAAINTVVHSLNNVTVYVKDIIDEVVTARGNKANLNARIAGVVDADGLPVAQAGVATTAQLASQVGARNIAVNGNLEDWTLGGALAPDSWTLSGAGATIARTGPAQADTFTFGAGTYAAKITRSGADAKLTQIVIASADFAAASNCKSQKVSVICKGKTAIANHLRIVVDDGVTQTYGGLSGNNTYHSGGGAEEHLYVTHTISPSATKLDVYAEVRSSNGDAYVGGVTIVFSDVAPTDWAPLSAVNLRQFPTAPVYKPGGSLTYDAIVSGVIYTNTTATQNSNAAETSLIAAVPTIKGNTLSGPGKCVRVTIEGHGNAAAVLRTFKVKLGGTLITTVSFTPAATAIFWKCVIEITRKATAATQVVSTNFCFSVGAAAFTNTPAIDVQSTTKDLSTDLTFDFTGQATTTGDITHDKTVVEVVG